MPEKIEHPRRIRSFVLRTGRMTEGQSEAFTEHWGEYGLEVADGAMSPAQMFGAEAPCVLEIGFGMGDSLLQMAQAAPETHFIGIEVHTPGVGRLLAGAAAAGLKNLRVYREDAVKILEDVLPEHSLDSIQLYFPDPWPKTKHHKRRLVQPAFLSLLARKLKPGGTLHIATDWKDYADHCIAVFAQCPQWVNTAQNGHFVERPEFRPETKFERRGKKLGHGVWDIIFEISQ